MVVSFKYIASPFSVDPTINLSSCTNLLQPLIVLLVRIRSTALQIESWSSGTPGTCGASNAESCCEPSSSLPTLRWMRKQKLKSQYNRCFRAPVHLAACDVRHD